MFGLNETFVIWTQQYGMFAILGLMLCGLVAGWVLPKALRMVTYGCLLWVMANLAYIHWYL